MLNNFPFQRWSHPASEVIRGCGPRLISGFMDRIHGGQWPRHVRLNRSGRRIPLEYAILHRPGQSNFSLPNSRWELSALTVWPDAEIKSSPNVSNNCPKISHCRFYLKCDVFQKSPKRHSTFWLLFEEIFYPRTFKNRPIWSNCPHICLFIILLGWPFSLSQAR